MWSSCHHHVLLYIVHVTHMYIRVQAPRHWHVIIWWDCDWIYRARGWLILIQVCSSHVFSSHQNYMNLFYFSRLAIIRACQTQLLGLGISVKYNIFKTAIPLKIWLLLHIFNLWIRVCKQSGGRRASLIVAHMLWHCHESNRDSQPIGFSFKSSMNMLKAERER